MRKIHHSQNFFRNKRVLKLLIKNSSITKHDLVIDIGAGDGEITKLLGIYAKQVIAIEKDKKLYNQLFNHLKSCSNIELLNLDILKYNFPQNRRYKVFSNIPFNHTADIVRLLTTQSNLSDDIYLFMQRQTALNYLGQPTTKESLKSLFSKLHFQIKIIHQFSRQDFYPIPKVDIVLLHLRKKPKPPINHLEIINFKDFVSYAFSQTKPNLKEGLSKIINTNNLNLVHKPTDLSFKEWISLFNHFQAHTNKKGKLLVKNSYQKLLAQQKNIQKNYRTRVDKHWKKKNPDHTSKV